MRVLLTSHVFLPQSVGGAELYVYYLARALQEAGHAVHVLAAEQAEERGVLRRNVDGLACTLLQKPFHPHEQVFAKADPRVATVFAELLDDFQPEVVHVNHLAHLSLALPQQARAAGVAAVATLHDHWFHCPTSHRLQYGSRRCSGPSLLKCARCCRWAYTRIPATRPADARLARIGKAVGRRLTACWEWPWAMRRLRHRAKAVAACLEAIQRVICPSRHVLEFSRHYGVPDDKLVFCRHGMPALPGTPHAPREETITRSVMSTERRPGPLRFGFIGSFNAVKGLEVALRAFARFDAAELHLYGHDGENRLRPFAPILAQPNVRYHGFLCDEDKLRALADLDCLIVPSTCYENSPLVIHEAFLAGVPVLVSNTGGMAELVPDGCGGLQFAVGDAADLREKVASLSREPSQLEKLRTTIPPVKGMGEHVGEIVGFYREARRSAGRGDRP